MQTIVDYIAVELAAEILLVTPRRVRQLIKAGRIPGAIQVGGNSRRSIWLIPVGEDSNPIITPAPENAPGPKPRWAKPVPPTDET